MGLLLLFTMQPSVVNGYCTAVREKKDGKSIKRFVQVYNLKDNLLAIMRIVVLVYHVSIVVYGHFTIKVYYCISLCLHAPYRNYGMTTSRSIMGGGPWTFFLCLCRSLLAQQIRSHRSHGQRILSCTLSLCTRSASARVAAYSH